MGVDCKDYLFSSIEKDRTDSTHPCVLKSQKTRPFGLLGIENFLCLSISAGEWRNQSLWGFSLPREVRGFCKSSWSRPRPRGLFRSPLPTAIWGLPDVPGAVSRPLWQPRSKVSPVEILGIQIPKQNTVIGNFFPEWSFGIDLPWLFLSSGTTVSGENWCLSYLGKLVEYVSSLCKRTMPVQSEILLGLCVALFPLSFPPSLLSPNPAQLDFYEESVIQL